MNQRILWRVEGLTPQTLIRPDNLALGMRRHLEHTADLISVLMQIQTQQRSYVLLDGCPGCLYRRCHPGCRVLLFGRTLRAASGSASTLVPITEGLAARRYTRVALAWPRRHARLLTANLLRPYPDARLLLHWRHRHLPRPTLTVAALLMVGTDGPDPAATLRESGWRAVSLPFRVHTLWTTPTPRGLLPGAAWRGEPAVLLPQDMSAATEGTDVLRPNDDPAPAASHAVLTHRVPGTTWHIGQPAPPAPQPLLPAAQDGSLMPLLTYALLTAANQALLHGVLLFAAAATPADTASTEPAPLSPADSSDPSAADDAVLITPPPPPSIWPAGPGTGKSAMAPADVGTVVEQMLTSETIAGGEPPGLSRKRLGALLPEIWKEHTQTLLAWFEAAGILDPPRDPADPWRHARPVHITDRDQIAERLQTTAIPTKP